MSFFNRNKIIMGIQVVNAATAILVLADFCKNPEASLAEYGLDIIIHATTFLSLRENSDILENATSIFLNTLRLGSIYQGLSISSTIPVLLNIVDLGQHILNIGVSYYQLQNTRDAAQPG